MTTQSWTDLFRVMASDLWREAGVPILNEAGKEAAKKVVSILQGAQEGKTSGAPERFRHSTFREAELSLQLAMNPDLAESEITEELIHSYRCFFKASTELSGFDAIKSLFLAAVCAELRGRPGIANALYEKVRQDAQEFLQQGGAEEIHRNAGTLGTILAWRPRTQSAAQLQPVIESSKELISAVESIQQARAKLAGAPPTGHRRWWWFS